jgi:hypothetical protein
MLDEQYIEHEVQIRLLRELTDEKFKSVYREFKAIQERSDILMNYMCESNDKRFMSLEKHIDRVDNKLAWIMTLILGSVVFPILIKLLGW